MTDDKLRERLLAERIARELARSDGIPDDASTGDYLRNARDLLAAMPELTRNTAELDRLEAENARKSAIADQLAKALEPFAAEAGDVNMNDPLSKWFTVAHFVEADALLTKLKASVDGATK